VTVAIMGMELRLRARLAISAALGLIILTALVGALFPSLGDSLGQLNLPRGVGDLLGGGDLSTLAGWLRTEITSVYGPLVFAGVAITAATATIAGEEEDRILALVLAHPVSRRRLLLAKSAAIALALAGLAVAVFGGMVLAVGLAGGGLGAGYLAAASLHLLFLALAIAALALALAAATGRRSLAGGTTAGVTLLMFLVNGFAPSIASVSWLKYLTVFHYYSGEDPLASGVHVAGLAVLGALTLALGAAAVAGFARRDLRG
jgi:beta-exotoxin I transport system permease protein